MPCCEGSTLVPDLTARPRAFICCLKRFSARRGIPQHIVSDNSKTFKSANKILQSLLNTPEVQLQGPVYRVAIYP